MTRAEEAAAQVALVIWKGYRAKFAPWDAPGDHERAVAAEALVAYHRAMAAPERERAKPKAGRKRR